MSLAALRPAARTTFRAITSTRIPINAIPKFPQLRKINMSSFEIPKTQKVLQFSRNGGPEVLEVNTSAPVPVPSANQLLVKNTYAGVNYIDTYFRTGLYPASLPYISGREAEGTVITAPAGSEFQPGDHVIYLGAQAQAEYTVVDPVNAFKRPAGLAEGVGAAAILQGLTALTLIREAHPVKAGDSVLVHAAAGGVGLWLCQLLRATGAKKIIATASTEEKLALAKENGATHGIRYTEEDWVARVKEITKEEGGVIAVFDGVGKDTFEGDMEVLARKGTLVSFGNASGAVPPLTIARLAPKNLKVLRPQLYGYVATREEFVPYAEELFDLILKDKVKVRVHKTYKLEEAQQAHKDIEGRGTTGKLLYKIE